VTSGHGFYERYTIHHHVRAVAGQGIVAGVVLLNEYVARKGLGCSRWHLLALLLAPSLAQFIAATWNPADPSRGPLGRAPFRLLGIPSRALLLLFLVPMLRTDTAFVVIMALALSTEALLLPVQNWTLAHNYAKATRARRFGMTTGIQALVIIAVVVPGGWALDKRPDAWPLLYAVAAAGGAYGYLHWSRLRRRWRRKARAEEHLPPQRPWKLLFTNKELLAFEAGFMVYGIGFLMLQPVLPIYLVDELHVSYGQVGLARGLLFWLGMSVASPLAGRMADSMGLFRTCALSFAVLTAFPLVLLLVRGPAALHLAYLVYGLAMGGVNVAWNLGPIVIARGRDPLPFLNAHVALVGVRALIGMVAGAWIQASFGTKPVFWAVVALELVAAVLMARLARREQRAGHLEPGDFEQPKAPSQA
jgi:hypothetical protein